MELSDQWEVPFVQKAGSQLIEVTAGKHFVIETSPAGEEILDEVVPEGKVWMVNIAIFVKEFDAE